MGAYWVWDRPQTFAAGSLGEEARDARTTPYWKKGTSQPGLGSTLPLIFR